MNEMAPKIRWTTALGLAVCISMAAAVSLGMTRFAYALLLPPMRDDLLWSYTLAGAMNTFNAAGYLVGALLTPLVLRRLGAVRVLIGGAFTATVFMAMTGFLTDTTALLFQRFLAGVASAAVFVSGGLLAARLGAHIPSQSGLLLGVYYGGTGWGIVLSALMVPASLSWAQAQAVDHPWSWSWWFLAGLCALLSMLIALIRSPLNRWAPESLPSVAATRSAQPAGKAWRPWLFALLGYGLCCRIVARTRGDAFRHYFVLCFFRHRCGRVILGLGRPVESLPWWPSAFYFERALECGHGDSCAYRGLAHDDVVWLDIWRRVFVSGRLNNGHGEAQLAAGGVGVRYQRVHRYFCAGSNSGARGGGLDCRWRRRLAAGPVIFCAGLVVGILFRVATKTTE